MTASTDFAEVVAVARSVPAPPEFEIQEIPAPSRLSPFAAAMTAELTKNDLELADGRLVILHDPAGQPAWEGQWRVVAFATAAVESEMANDPVLSDVGWSWLEDAIGVIPEPITALGGTVTRTHSHSYGALADQEGRGNLELRASWTPVNQQGVAPSVSAWIQLLATMAGLEPLPAGVARIS